ncbi:YCF48-related protein [Roseateles oligotrophus]|uniref:YCF48-related protein n=1 Tax=Roseateles oligotrophus TaxID=1769250 RepID=A0ABT2YCG9_9BURK|nr:YCF48-related protein [Roseateles oligotrophus]MCV2367743.1 YCF48-related protein [Roseateles oligotrophus]
MKYTSQVLAITVLVSSLLSACGGGSEGSTPVEPPTPVTPATVIPETLSIKAAASADVGSAASFDNSAAALTGLKFAWSFGDGASSTEPAPKHEFAKVGDYDVTLKVSNEAGSSKELKFRVSVNNRTHVKGLACTGAADSGWCWQMPKPSGNDRADLFFLDSKTAWSVGSNGEILKSSDGAKTWVGQVSGLRTRLTSIRFADANNGWAVGEYGAVLRTVDGGANWVLQASWSRQDSPYPNSNSLSLSVINATTAVIVGDDFITASSDGGATWAQRKLRLDRIDADGAIWSRSEDKLFKSTDLGKTQVELLAKLNYSTSGSITMGKSGVLLSEGVQSYDYETGRSTYKLNLRRSQDAGLTWERFDAQGLPAIGYFTVQKIVFTDALNGILSLVGNDTSLYTTSDGGRNWQAMVFALNASSYQSQLSLLPSGAIYRAVSDSTNNSFKRDFSEDLGRTWREIQLPGNGYEVSGLRKVGAKTWALKHAYFGLEYISSDDMLTWRLAVGKEAQFAQSSFIATWFFDAKRALAISAAGELLETSNGGLDWTVKLKDLVKPDYWNQVRFQFLSATKGWLLAADGKVYRSIDAGATWASPLSGTAKISQFQFIDENKGYALSTELRPGSFYPTPVLLTSIDAGQSWAKVADFVEGINSIHFANAKQGVAVGNGGRIVSTQDGGLTWQSRFSGTGSELRRVVFVDATTVWAIGANGTVLQSRDAGQTWSISMQGDAVQLQDIQFLDAQRGWVVGSAGAILSTQDGGKTWQRIYSGTQKTLNQVFFVDPRTGWVSGEDGSLLATGTGGI